MTSLSLFIFMHWRRKWQPTPVFLPGESQGRGSLLGCRLWGRTELDTLSSSSSSSVQSLSHVQLFPTPWTAARQASLSITNSQNVLKLMSIASVVPSSHLILCHPLLLLPSVFPSIRVFPNESVLCIKWPKHSIWVIHPFLDGCGLSHFRMRPVASGSDFI